MCHGNICRSPYAASLLRQALAYRGSSIQVLQGGFVGPGRRSPATARGAARAAGVDLREHLSRMATPQDVEGRTLVVVMEEIHAERAIKDLGARANQLLLLGDLDPAPIDARGIRDPWGFGREIFEVVYERIARCTVVLADSLREPSAQRVDGGHSPLVIASEPAAAPNDDALQIRLTNS